MALLRVVVGLAFCPAPSEKEELMPPHKQHWQHVQQGTMGLCTLSKAQGTASCSPWNPHPPHAQVVALHRHHWVACGSQARDEGHIGQQAQACTVQRRGGRGLTRGCGVPNRPMCTLFFLPVSSQD